jgi:cyclopropane fatty-acyl-phospholipid synthase-like methyltransferase
MVLSMLTCVAARQCLVTAVDFSGELLDDLRRAASERNVVITAEKRDMRDITYRRAFDAVICWWGSFGYSSLLRVFFIFSDT